MSKLIVFRSFFLATRLFLYVFTSHTKYSRNGLFLPFEQCCTSLCFGQNGRIERAFNSYSFQFIWIYRSRSSSVDRSCICRNHKQVETQWTKNFPVRLLRHFTRQTFSSRVVFWQVRTTVQFSLAAVRICNFEFCFGGSYKCRLLLVLCEVSGRPVPSRYDTWRRKSSTATKNQDSSGFLYLFSSSSGSTTARICVYGVA